MGTVSSTVRASWMQVLSVCFEIRIVSSGSGIANSLLPRISLMVDSGMTTM